MPSTNRKGHLMIGYTLGATRAGRLTLHRVWGSVPGWALCGTWCPVFPHVPAEATGKFCQRCVDLEKQEDSSLVTPPPDRLAEIKRDIERGGDDSWPTAAVRELVGQVERLQRDVEELSERLAAAQITIGQLSHQRARLRELLHAHGIDPDGTANAAPSTRR